ncbi:MAG: DUF4398 domain-containing protein [Ectothiorhodospiraceae bacterium]
MKTANEIRRERPWLLATALATGLLLLTACASTPVAPTASLTEARDAIARAEQTGGRQYAGTELDEAQQKLAMAESAVDEMDMGEAERLAEEAQVTAELASARTASAKAAEVNREMGRSAEALTEEMRRTGEQQ